MKSNKLEKIWSFLNKDIKSLFKREYDLEFINVDNNTIEVKKYNRRTGEEVPYNFPLYLRTVPRGSYNCSG